MLKLVQESHLGWTSVIQVFVLLSTGLGLQRKSKLSSVPVRHIISNSDIHIITVKNRWLMPHDIPEWPWKKFAMDIMTFKGNDYIVAVNHSKFLEKVELNVWLWCVIVRDDMPSALHSSNSQSDGVLCNTHEALHSHSQMDKMNVLYKQ